MAFVLILIAIILIVTAINGTTSQLASLLKQDVTGPDNFAIWLFAFLVIGAVGYVPSFKKLSDSFLLLVIVVILISNDKNGNGFFSNLQAAMRGSSGGAAGASSTGSVSIAPFNTGNFLSTPLISSTVST